MKEEIIEKARELETLLFNCVDTEFVEDVINRLVNNDAIDESLLDEYPDEEEEEDEYPDDEVYWGYSEDDSYEEYNKFD